VAQVAPQAAPDMVIGGQLTSFGVLPAVSPIVTVILFTVIGV
jgi:hypothetical protein